MRKKSAVWKWLTSAGLVSLLMVYFAIWCDPLFQLGLKLNENPMWLTGFGAMIKLPPTATPDEIVAAEIKAEGPANDISSYEIVERGTIRILPDRSLSAVVIETDSGKKQIKTYSYASPANYWWVKTYDVP